MSMRNLKKKKGVVTDAQRCQAMLIETSRSQAQKQSQRERKIEEAGAIRELDSPEFGCTAQALCCFVCGLVSVRQ